MASARYRETYEFVPSGVAYFNDRGPDDRSLTVEAHWTLRNGTLRLTHHASDGQPFDEIFVRSSTNADEIIRRPR